MPYAPFGATTDHFSLVTTDLVLESGSKTPIALSRADAQNEHGDIVASTWFGAPGTMFDAENTYLLKSGSLNLNTLALGLKAAGIVILKIGITTGNGEWPKIKVSGKLGALADWGTFTLPSITIQGKKLAQVMGFTTAEGCRLTGSAFEFSCNMPEATNGLGVPVAQAIDGATGSLSADFVGVTAAPAWTVTLSGATETQAPGSEEPQAAYNTGSGTAEIVLTRNTTTTTTT